MLLPNAPEYGNVTPTSSYVPFPSASILMLVGTTVLDVRCALRFDELMLVATPVPAFEIVTVQRITVPGIALPPRPPEMMSLSPPASTIDTSAADTVVVTPSVELTLPPVGAVGEAVCVVAVRLRMIVCPFVALAGTVTRT